MTDIKFGFIQNGRLLKKAKFSGSKPQEVVVGRSGGAQLQIDLNIISGQHLQLIYDGTGRLYITDLGSTNGTYINGNKISANKPVPISEKDIIILAGANGVQLVFNPDDYSSAQRENGQSMPAAKEIPMGETVWEKLSRKDKIIIGRSPDCDIVLNYDFISRQHVSIERKGNNRFLITDLNSLNGTFLNGKRIQKSEFTENDDVFLGRLRLTLRNPIRDLSTEVAVRADRIIKRFGNNKIGLHEASFEIPSKTMLAIMGPSGCGKSTLLKALNGDSPVSSGKIYICGLELNQNYDYLKTQIGYVPQDDIVHRELTVEQSLYYAAKLRLENASEQDMQNKIRTVLTDLNIYQIKESPVHKISGGQRKRLSIAVELLTDPMILFLDEPTSPLDPQSIEDFMESLQNLAKKGTTVILVTHKPEDLYYMDSVIFMAEGGYMVYYNDAKSYLRYFDVPNTAKVYSNLVDEKAPYWIQKYKTENPAVPNTGSKPWPRKDSHSTNYLSQYWWLTQRYFNIKLNDVANSLIMVGQAPIIAALICMIFSSIGQAIPFLLTISALWFGVNNAAREIVAELPIYKRERMFNQAIIPYILSKVTVLGSFAAVQCMIFTAIMYLRYSGCASTEVCVNWNDPLLTFTWMLFVSVVGTLMGLFLSAIVTTTEKVMTLVPIVLIPQIMLAGLIAKINSLPVEWMSYLTLSRWGTEGFCHIQKEVIITQPLVPGTSDTEAISQDMVANAVDNLTANYHHSYFDNFGSFAATFKLDIIVLLIMGFSFFIAVYMALKSKDPLKVNY